MTPTTELPDEIYLSEFDPDIAFRNKDDALSRTRDGKTTTVTAYTRKDKSDAEIARLRAAVRDLRHGAFGDALEKHADTIKECMKDE